MLRAYAEYIRSSSDEVTAYAEYAHSILAR